MSDQEHIELSAALAEPQTTHSAECYKLHHDCAVAEVERLRLVCEEMLSELYVYRASKQLKDVTAAIRARKENDCPPNSHQPVAWMVYTLDGQSVCVTDNPEDFTPQHRALPLYTAPSQRKPLTDEEIEMNPRIQALADEAEDYADGIVDQGGEFHPAYTRKLAELIVRECAKRSVELGNPELGEGLMKHFGVEE